MPRTITHAGSRAVVAIGRPEHVDLAIPASPQPLADIMRGYPSRWVFAGGGGFFAVGGITRTSPLRTNAYGWLVRGKTVVQTGYQARPVFAVVGGRASIIFGAPPGNAAIAVEAGPLLLRDGQLADINVEISKGQLTGLQPTTRRARAGIGIRPDGAVVYAAMQAGTLAELQDLLRAQGCRDAMGLDGGNSVGVVTPGYVALGQSSRALPAAIVLRETVSGGQPAPISGGGDTVRLMIDPGHTGATDPGAVSGSVREADVNLDVALHLRDLLAGTPGLEVRLTRDKHGDLAKPYSAAADLRARTDMANAWPATHYLSIHVNAATNTAAHGVETYHWATSKEGKRMAGIVHQHVAPLFRADRGVKTANFHVLRETKMPATLVELGFVTNPEDRERLAESWFRISLAEALAAGIREAFGLQSAPQGAPGPFPDVPGDHWAAGAIAWAKARGLMAGYPDGTFRPEAPVTRAELASALERLQDKR